MKNLIAIIAVFFNVSSFSKILHMKSGHRVQCKELSDVNYSQKMPIVRLSDEKVQDFGTELDIEIKVSFIKCVQNEDGSFSFIDNPDYKRSEFLIYNSHGDRGKALRIDKDHGLVVTKVGYHTILKTPLIESGDELFFKMTISKSDLERPEDVGMNLDATHFTTLNIMSKRRYITQTYDSGWFRKFFRGARLLMKLNNKNELTSFKLQ